MTNDLDRLQSYLGEVFGKVNSEITPDWLLNRLCRRVTCLMRLVGKKDMANAKLAIANAFSWLFALANHPQVKVNLKELTLNHFPGICPYCTTAPCSCGTTRPPERLSSYYLQSIAEKIPKDVDIQKMLASIYTRGDLLDSLHHLADEGNELWEVMVAKINFERRWSSFTNPRWFDDINYPNDDFRMEITDMVAHLFAVATLLGVNLVEETMQLFKDGCSSCKEKTCQCDPLGIRIVRVGSKAVIDGVPS